MYSSDNLLNPAKMENKIILVRRHYGMPVYGVTYDDGKTGGYVELRPGEEPTYDNVLRAIINDMWPEERQHALLLALQFAPEGPDTIKERNARAYEYQIAVESARAAVANLEC